MFKKQAFSCIAYFALCIFVTGCGDSSDAPATTDSPSHDTAAAVTAGMINATDQSEEMKQLRLQQPEVTSIILCIAEHLEHQGWTREQYDFLMEETENTGNIGMINQSKYDEAETLKHFGPLFMATGSCM